MLLGFLYDQIPSSTERNANLGLQKSPTRRKRSRVLTMKYGKHQMMLIRKRMKIENWIDAEVTKLFNGNDNNVSFEILLDHLQRNHCPASMDKITMFLDEMIDQINTL
ncbi:unnamed protein product [Heligmosomoides polygyrus]|uniref:Protein phosphatase 1 regulatory subunit 14B n=1 Tax=Heligmosomoides polygyrus TaxID=6339 RepID=A0A183GMB6_HELPZ|nr:unnamed protein product [Heligmosomoides polygyrus]